VSVAGQVQAVPVSTPEIAAFETAHAQELSLAAESAANRTAALLAQLPHLQQTGMSLGLQASLVRMGKNIVARRSSTLLAENHSGLRRLSSIRVDLPNNGGIVLEPAMYHIPISVMIVPRGDWPTPIVAGLAATVPDGASTALWFRATVFGAVLLRRQLATRF